MTSRATESPRWLAPRSALARDTRGAVYVEFIIAFMPLLFTFFCVWESSRMFTASLLVQHSANVASRHAATILADDPKRFNDESVGEVGDKRRLAVKGYAFLALAALMYDGSFLAADVSFPSGGGAGDVTRYGPGDIVRVGVEATYRCRIPLARNVMCETDGFGGWAVGPWKRTLHAVGAYPYMGANFTYKE